MVVFGRTGRLAFGGALAAVLAGGVVSAGSAATVPNPCTIVPSSVISSSVGFSGAALTGKISTRPDGALKQTLCTFTKGGAKLEIYIAPHQPSGGSGGPPGMVVTKPAGLGSGATFAYDVNPQYAFANVSFTKTGFDAGVWDNGKLPNAAVLALARKVYAALR